MSTLQDAHALVIGIANYRNVSALPPIVLKDASDIYAHITDPNYCAYPQESTQLLLDQQATQIAIREGLADLREKSSPSSTVFIYVSSHGGTIESGLHAGEYLLPIDVRTDSNQSLAETAISGAELTEAIRGLHAKKVVVIFDCCHSGGIGYPKNAKASEVKALPERYYELLKNGRGRVIIASSRSDEFSYVLPGASNSLFTLHLLDGLRGGAPGPGGVIRIFDLFNYLQPKVTSSHNAQHPIFKAELEENFPIALYCGGKTSAPGPLQAPVDDFKYDVFLSYSQDEPDKTWVRKVLLPRLEKESGLHVCIDYRDFRLGAPVVLEMARAVENSRYTVAVLSPGYLESNFTELETVLAEHLGLENSQRRLLAVMRHSCRPRLGLRARLWLDMTQDEEFEIDVERLVYELRQEPSK